MENNNKSYENITNEDNVTNDMLVVDWKNMTPLKITSISELQVHDLLQFKVSGFFLYYYFLCIHIYMYSIIN